MAYASFRDFCLSAKLAGGAEYDQWILDWRRLRAEENLGDTLSEYICKQAGKTEDEFLGLVAEAIDWERVELAELTPS